MANKVADDGNVFVCLACGKLSKDKYGFDKISHGWDESCMLNSVEIPEERLIYNESKTRVVQIKED